MSNITKSFRKGTAEVIEAAEDRIAQLKLAGKADEALEEEKRLARIKKNYAQEEKELARENEPTALVPAGPVKDVGPIITAPPGYVEVRDKDGVVRGFKKAYPDEGQAKIVSSSKEPDTRPDYLSLEDAEKSFQRPEVGIDDFKLNTDVSKTNYFDNEYNPGKMPRGTFDSRPEPDEIDLSDWSRPLPREKAGMSKAQKAGGAAALGALGFASSTGDETLPPQKPGEAPLKMAMGAKKAEAPSSTTETASSPAIDTPSVPTPSRVSAPAVKNYLAELAEPPKEFDASNWNNKISGLDEERKSLVAQMKKDVADAVAVAEAAKGSVEKRELMENLVNAVGMMVSGLHGQRSGLDMSGVKFSSTDWNQKLQNIRADLRDKMERLKEAQAIDQGLVDEKRRALSESKEDAFRTYQSLWTQYNAKSQKAQAQQDSAYKQAGMQFDADRVNAQMAFDADKFNAQLKLDADKAAAELKRKIDEDRAKGKSEKDLGATIRATKDTRLADLEKQYTDSVNALVNEKQTDSDEQAQARLATLQALDAQITKLRGYPMLPGPNLTPRNYLEIDPDEIGASLQAAASQEEKLDSAVSNFQNPALQGKKDFVRNRKMYISAATNKLVGQGMAADAADEAATNQYREALRKMFEQEAEWQSQNGVRK